MKILVATLGHSPDDDRVYHKQIRSLLKGGHQVTLVTRSQPTTDNDQSGFSHVDLGPVAVNPFGKALQALAQKWRPDVLQIHEFLLLVSAGRIKKKLALPVVYDVQDANIEMWATFSSKSPVLKHMINWGLLGFEKMHLKHVDRVSALSSHIARRYAEWGLKSVLIPNYPRLTPLDPDRQQREPLVIYHGQLSPERGLLHLIKAFAGVVEEVPKARLEIYGRGRIPGLTKQLQIEVDRSGMDEHIAIHPPMPYQDILQQLTRARIGVIPFLDRPLFRVAPPNKLYEYMLCGCAVVASDLPVLREEGRDSVLFTPPGDITALQAGLVRILRDTDLCWNLAKKGRELIESEYHWERVEPEYLRLYEELE